MGEDEEKDSMILESDIVRERIQQFKKALPEVPVLFEEVAEGLRIYLPAWTNDLPPLVQVLLRQEFSAMMQDFQMLQVPAWFEGVHYDRG